MHECDEHCLRELKFNSGIECGNADMNRKALRNILHIFFLQISLCQRVTIKKVLNVELFLLGYDLRFR